MKYTVRIFTFLILVSALTVMTSCKKYNKYDNKEVVEDSYAGNIELKGDRDEPSGDFSGSNDSGEFSFVFENSKEVASIEYSATFSSGSVNLIINDAKGNEVFNTIINDSNTSSSGKTSEGKEGKWLVTFIFTDFEGSGSYEIEN
ncbi:MAG: hypothetical protein ACQETL_00675 [Bacteroidota bacterium]